MDYAENGNIYNVYLTHITGDLQKKIKEAKIK
jgi:hypothetical protein